MTNAKPVDSVEDFRNRGAGWISETNRTIVVISHIGCAAPL